MRLHLKSGVADAKARLQLLRRLHQESVGGALRHHEMTGQRRLGRAHAPDVQVVQSSYPGKACQVGAHRGSVDRGRHRVEREAQRLPDEVPGAVDDDRRDEKEAAQGAATVPEAPFI